MVRPMHPTFGENLIQSDLRNLIGNPLETAALFSNLIFEGTLDRFPGLRVVASHGGGYLESYLRCSNVGCERVNADREPSAPSRSNRLPRFQELPGNGNATIDPRIKFLWRDEGMGFTSVSGRQPFSANEQVAKGNC